jgi:heat shock protein HslJ
MRLPSAAWTLGFAGWLVSLAILAAISASLAADRSFPYDSTLLLEAKPMKGSKRVPILEIGSKGEASISLWCNTAPAQLVVVDATITILLGAPTRQQCEPERMQADEDLVQALQQVGSWQREDDLLVLEGERPLRFRLATN